MKLGRTERGFDIVTHPNYPTGEECRLVQASSVIYEDARGPGTSALWIGANHHLNREEVAALIEHLQSWLETGGL